MNMNPMMLNNDIKNSNQNELFSNLINQNIQMANQISINNNIMKSMIQNQDMDKNNSLDDIINNIDYFPLYEGKKINVIFKSDNGISINVIAPLNCKMKELLTVFYIKLQIYGKINNIEIWNLKEYLFLNNGHIMFLNEEKPISDYGLFNDIHSIIFKLRNEIIGG